MTHLIPFLALAAAGSIILWMAFHHRRSQDAKGIERGKARADRNPNPMNAIPQVMLDRAKGLIADVCAECGRPYHRPHSADCKSRGVKIIQDRSGRQKGERI